MKIKVIVEDVGSNHAKVEIEENCGIEELRAMMDRINRELTRQTERPANQRRTYANGQVGNSNFTPSPKPPTQDALNALEKAAKANGTDVETVCREYRVDPNCISKAQCWQMTHDLNEQSGYVNKNPAKFVGDIF